MLNPLVMKLEHAGGLEEADRAALQELSAVTRPIEARYDLSCEGDRPEIVHLVMEGRAFRYKLTPNGERQILGLLLPGDFCDFHVAILARRDHSVGTLTPCRIAEIPRTTILDITAKLPSVARAFWWATLVDESILRQWLTSMGKRDALERVAHLFCELLIRLQAVGLATANGYDLRLTQAELSDVAGLSTVHTNRVLQELRKQKLIVFKHSHMEIPDVLRLKNFCGFDPNYLHLDLRPAQA
ncbi:MAG: Crp/Fnr family transcriptional regulator [Oxalobacteraceae bacterium]|nr:MAG: Crp/Fnr family transcriptional regulator [Oxalobacteraceae bacterium]